MKCCVCEGDARLIKNHQEKSDFLRGKIGYPDTVRCPHCGGNGEEPAESILSENEKSRLRSLRLRQ